MFFYNILLVLLCYFGDRFTDRLSKINDIIYNANWHNYPTEVRKYLQLMMTASQKPIHLEGHFGFKASLEIYEKVRSFNEILKGLCKRLHFFLALLTDFKYLLFNDYALASYIRQLIITDRNR